MTTEDSGWGGYVPPEEEGTPRSSTGQPGRPPPDRPPWWQSRGTLAVAAVTVLIVVGVAASGVFSGHTTGGSSSTTPTIPKPGPTTPTPGPSPTSTTPGPSPTSTTPKPGPTTTTSSETGPANADFIAKADAVCTQAAPDIQNDLGALNAPNLNALPVSTSDTSDLARHFGAVVTGLRALGNPPVDDASFATGVADWKQALDLLSPGDTEDFTINYNAGVIQFRKLGLKVCSGGSAD